MLNRGYPAFFIAGHSVECPFLLKINKRGVIEVVESKSFTSVADFSRRHKYNARLLNMLINHYKIKPDIRSGNVKLFEEERLKSIMNGLNNMLGREN